MVLAPVKSVKLPVLPAALPDVGMLCASQLALWSAGIDSPRSDSGASMIVAVSPMMTCHSIWQ